MAENRTSLGLAYGSRDTGCIAKLYTRYLSNRESSMNDNCLFLLVINRKIYRTRTPWVGVLCTLPGKKKENFSGKKKSYAMIYNCIYLFIRSKRVRNTSTSSGNT
uniref:Uncharacterized protein n=1 Tax=Cacopsylla melanoneura TaxID=428564 RepID=A0A8D8L9S8_9HEMI